MSYDKQARAFSLKTLICATVVVAPPMLAAGPAYAQEQASQDQEEIVVTAQRREQALIDVPAAITAIGGEQIQDLNLSNMPDVASQVPNFSISYASGTNATPNFNIRGVSGDQLPGRLNESSVAIYTDDVYLGDENMLNAGLFDLQRVEILRGPQGTLFGRNTTAGLVHFISKAPTREFSGYGNALYGADNTVTIEGALSGPIGDRVRVRIAGKWDRNDGHYTNKYLGAGQNGIPKRLGARDIWGLRGTIDIDLTSRTTLRVIGAYGENNSETTPLNVVGSLQPGTPFAASYTRAQQCSISQIYDGLCISSTQNSAPGRLRNPRDEPATAITPLTHEQLRVIGRGKAFTAKLTHEMQWAKLTSITNFSTNRFEANNDGGYFTPTIGGSIPVILPRINKAKQFSEELRLNGSTDAFDWVAGVLYYVDEKDSRVLRNINNGFLRTEAAASVESRSHALFGQIDAHISDQVTLTIGARYTGDKRELTDAVTFDNFGNFQDVRAYMIARGLPVKSNNKDLTGKLGLVWEPTDNSTYYASLSRGLKGAGFNNGFSPTNVSNPNPIIAAAAQAANAAIAGPVPQEVVDALEVGAKMRFLNGRLTVNSALFFYRYTGKQVFLATFDVATNTAVFNYISVGKAKAWGAETEIRFQPDRHWDFSLSGGWTGSKITESSLIVRDNFGVPTSLEGKRLIFTPKWTFNATVAYHLPVQDVGTFTLQTELHGNGPWNSSLVNEPLAEVPSYILTNLRILWESSNGRYNAQAFVTNVFDKKYPLLTNDVVIGQLGNFIIAEGEGRLWGVKFGVRF